MKRNLIRVLTGLFLAVLSVMSMSSCSKDEMNEKNIVGKWQSTSMTVKEYVAGKLVAEQSVNCVDFYIGFNFKSDGTGQMINYEGGESETLHGTWVIMGDKLMLTATDYGTETFDLISINGSSMTLELTEEYTEEGVKCSVVTTVYFKKI